VPKMIKYALIAIAAIVLAVTAVVVIAPRLLHLDAYKQKIEAQVHAATGLKLTVGDTVKPSFFPWVGIGLQSLKLSNPDGFKEKDFVTIDDFEVRVKLLPLLARHVEVKRLNIEGVTLALEKNERGQGNWESIGSKTQPSAAPADAPRASEPSEKGARPWPIASLQADRLSISNARVVYSDPGAGKRVELDQLALDIEDLTLDKPVTARLSALLDQRPISLRATVGPIGSEPGKAPIAFSLAASLIERLSIECTGGLLDAGAKKVEAAVRIAPFSPRDLLAEFKQPLPWAPADPKVLGRLGADFSLSAAADALTITKGSMTLDDSRIDFSGRIADFSKPNLVLDLALDRLDLDRYLPPPASPSKPSAPARPARRTAADKAGAGAIEDAPLRKLALDASVKIADLKVRDTRAQQVHLQAVAKNGVIRVDPLDGALFQGRLKAAAGLDLRQNRPRTTLDIELTRVQSGPLLRQLLHKEMVEGLLSATVTARFNGDTWPLIRKTLSGKGALNFSDGAIVGIDLADMARNVQSAFGLADKPAVKPKTDFSELSVPFTLTNGLARVTGATLNAPLLRVAAEGTAHLVTEALDLRVEPKFVGTLVGQGDTRQRSGVAVPVLVGGTFSEPTFRPDLKGMLQQQLKDPRVIEKLVPEGKARDILRALPFGTRP